MIQFDAWQIIEIVGALCACVFAFSRLFFGQAIKAINKQFSVFEEEMKVLHAQDSKATEDFRQLERSFLTFRADLPREYVLKQDLERFREFIEARVQEIRTLIVGLEQAVKDKADKE